MTETKWRHLLVEATNALVDVRDILCVVQMALMLDAHRDGLTRSDCDAMLHVVSLAYDQAKKGCDEAAVL